MAMSRTTVRVLKGVGIFLTALFVTGFVLYIVYIRPVMKKIQHQETVQFDKDLTLALGGGGNSGILVSDSMVLVVDTKFGDGAADLQKNVKQLAGSKPIFVVNTHYHKDHCEGNQYYHDQTIAAGGNYTEELWTKNGGAENMPNRWIKDTLQFKIGDDTAIVFNLGYRAHTESDVMVYLKRRKILFGGDVILNKQAPSLASADVDGYVRAFDSVQKKFPIATVVPGHGPVGGTEIISDFRTFFKDMQTAANDPSQRDALLAKYDDWTQVPKLMSPANTIDAYKNKKP